jgi:hypothetical protein
VFKVGNEIFRGQPVRRQRQPPLRMVRRAQAVEFPDRARQEAACQFVAVAPPTIPGASQIGVGTLLRAGQLGRQEPADAEQARLEGKGGTRAARPAGWDLKHIFAGIKAIRFLKESKKNCCLRAANMNSSTFLMHNVSSANFGIKACPVVSRSEFFHFIVRTPAEYPRIFRSIL